VRVKDSTAEAKKGANILVPSALGGGKECCLNWKTIKERN